MARAQVDLPLHVAPARPTIIMIMVDASHAQNHVLWVSRNGTYSRRQLRPPSNTDETTRLSCHTHTMVLFAVKCRVQRTMSTTALHLGTKVLRRQTTSNPRRRRRKERNRSQESGRFFFFTSLRRDLGGMLYRIFFSPEMKKQTAIPSSLLLFDSLGLVPGFIMA